MPKKFLDFDLEMPSDNAQALDPNIDWKALKQYQNEVFHCLYQISSITARQNEIKNDNSLEVHEKKQRMDEFDKLYYEQRKLSMECLARIRKIHPNDSFLRTVLDVHKIDLAALNDLALEQHW